MAKKKRPPLVSVYFPDEKILEKLKELAEKEDRSLGKTVYHIVKIYIQEKEGSEGVDRPS